MFPRCLEHCNAEHCNAEGTLSEYFRNIACRLGYSSNCMEYESNSNRKKTLSITIRDKIKPYLKDNINNCKKSETWRNQLIIENNFTSFKDTDEEHVMNSKSGNMEIMIFDKSDEFSEKVLIHFLKEIKLGCKHQ